MTPSSGAEQTSSREARAALFDQAVRFSPYIGVQADEGRFIAATSDQGVARGLFVKRGRPEFKVLSRAVAMVEALTGRDAIADRLFVDVGANIGTATICALTSHRFGAALACEPEEENFRLLRANLALNDLEERVRTLRVAVSNRVGTDPNASWPAQIAEMTVVDVELVTLDRLAKDGVIDRDRLGMVWIDAEGHEGHILEGAGTLADQGVPIVFEFHPAGRDERGDRHKVHEIAGHCYTHFVDVRRREVDRAEPRLDLHPVSELDPYAKRFLNPCIAERFTDLLMLRLDAEQVPTGTDPR